MTEHKVRSGSLTLTGRIQPIDVSSVIASEVRQELEAELSQSGEGAGNMHYANGREAKNGDKVVLFGYGGPVIGILYDATAGNDFCNGKIAVTRPNDPCPNLKECLHLEDVLKALPKEVPDSSTKP